MYCPYAKMHLPEESNKELFGNAIKGEWQGVIDIYKNNQEAHAAKITKSGDTALHMAISDGQESVVKKLVSMVDPTTLKIGNELGNTPLHLAAYQDSVEMCHSIASRDSKLMGIRNGVNETPFFLAGVHGKKKAFFCMHQLCKTKRKGYKYGRRKDGMTILHAAISGEHFDLALHIIHLYDKLRNRNDERGISPLHILASKPSAFQSGSRVRGLHKLIYRCLSIEKLKSTDVPSQDDAENNSRTPFSLIRRLRNITCNHRVEKKDAENPNGQQIYPEKAMAHKNHSTCFHGLKLIFKAIGLFLGLGPISIQKIREEKEKHTWSVQIMDKLLDNSSPYEYQYGGDSHLLNAEEGKVPYAFDKRGSVKFSDDIIGDYGDQPFQDDNSLEAQQGKIEKKDKAMQNKKKESPLLIAAKNGIKEMVEKIVETFPVAIHDANVDGKNIVLLAVENRQPDIYDFLLKQKKLKDTIFYKTDKDTNSALHIAAQQYCDTRNWNISGPALQMQWEVKWYEYVEKSMPPKFFVRYNNEGQTPWNEFRETHKELVKEASGWLNTTSQSCATVATLIATVAFTASATIPGGIRGDTGSPLLEKEPAFNIFAISSLIALCFSISSVVMFLVFFTSRYHERDFGTNLPTKLLVELTSLLISIAAVLVSFCAAHFFVIKDNLKYTALPLYAVTCFPVALYAVWQFPTYIDLAVATFSDKPQRIYDYD